MPPDEVVTFFFPFVVSDKSNKYKCKITHFLQKASSSRGNKSYPVVDNLSLHTHTHTQTQTGASLEEEQPKHQWLTMMQERKRKAQDDLPSIADMVKRV